MHFGTHKQTFWDLFLTGILDPLADELRYTEAWELYLGPEEEL